MIKAVLTDIEGTTSSIEFVHKVLFPYAREAFPNFLASSKDPEVLALIKKLWIEEIGNPEGNSPDIEQVSSLLQKWIDQDLKQPILKTLQGKVWKEGYASKAYFGHVYPEVASAFANWKNQNLHLAIYSSGSVEAQQLIFGHSEAGDLTTLIDSYFDTKVGAKREVLSYSSIATQLNFKPSEIVFLSDIKEELDAARAAGMRTIQLLREPLPVIGDHATAKNFAEVTQMLEGF